MTEMNIQAIIVVLDKEEFRRTREKAFGGMPHFYRR